MVVVTTVVPPAAAPLSHFCSDCAVVLVVTVVTVMPPASDVTALVTADVPLVSTPPFLAAFFVRAMVTCDLTRALAGAPGAPGVLLPEERRALPTSANILNQLLNIPTSDYYGNLLDPCRFQYSLSLFMGVK